MLVRPFLAALAAAVALPAAAQNLVTNAGFPSNLSGWSVAGGAGTGVWSTADAGGGTGSALMSASAPAAGTAIHLQQCVTVTAGPYRFAGKARVPSGQAAAGRARIGFQGFESADCAGAGLVVDETPDVSGFDAWQPLVKTTNLPATARSARIYTVTQKTPPGGTFQAYFDDLAVVKSGGTSVLTIPASASLRGANDTFFQTDLWVLNRSFGETLDVAARYRCFAGQSCPNATQTLRIAPRQLMHFTDAVATLFSAPGTAGAIELTWDPAFGAISASSRTHSPAVPAPTTGTGVPASASGEARTRAVFLGVGSNGGDFSAGFRSNAGAYNPAATPVSVTFTLFSGDGVRLGSPVVRSFGANEAGQINDLFSAVGSGETVTRGAYLVVSATGPVFPYATLIDNQSGDSVFVPISNDEAP